MRPPLPDGTVPFVDSETGLISQAWQQFIAKLVGEPKSIVAIAVGASPFSYQAQDDGNVSVVGGTVTDISIKRAAVTLATGLTVGLIPVSQADTVIVTYAVAPTMKYIPG